MPNPPSDPPYPSAQQVYALLLRHRSPAPGRAGHNLLENLSTWIGGGVSGWVSVDLPGDNAAQILLQEGRPVHAAYQHFKPSEALIALSAWLDSRAVTLLRLSDADARLSYAAVDGEALHLGASLASESVQSALLDKLRRSQLEGVLALEGRSTLKVWSVRSGVLQGEPPGPPSAAQLTLLRWRERALPQLSLEPLGGVLEQIVPASSIWDSTRVWRVFEREVRDRLEDRAERYLGLMRRAHHATRGEQLVVDLSRELQRTTGQPNLVELLRQADL